MQTYRGIACGHYDFLELACIRRYPLLLELKDEGRIHGRAVTLETRADKSEWLQVETATASRAIRLDRIIAITPDIEGAEFGRILISP
ncbi:transcriptional antiterminator [Shewanella sp. JM162201]|uniref:Transcriptional antiterminator n=1 Tax=Shewanella jiangmenensis TaxID=2837387 RepID=A0ABS5V6V2_9GAMM|nr:Rho-binding antiterminator [Shewanella jiangmenensis]MBT1445381.1 transcriptional antiterminator [Shewanella jiangmenensis]